MLTCDPGFFELTPAHYVWFKGLSISFRTKINPKGGYHEGGRRPHQLHLLPQNRFLTKCSSQLRVSSGKIRNWASKQEHQ